MCKIFSATLLAILFISELKRTVHTVHTLPKMGENKHYHDCVKLDKQGMKKFKPGKQQPVCHQNSLEHNLE